MKLEHIAIWVNSLVEMKNFYVDYFGATANELYRNDKKDFSSYFLTFESGSKIELMYNPEIPQIDGDAKAQYMGYAHLSMELESREAVDLLTEKLDDDGFDIVDKPRITGYGTYESVILDPEGNRIEIRSN